MTDWLSFWNEATREENAARLTGREIERIYIPYGAGRVSVGDHIYCVGIQEGQLLLITRIDATGVKPDHDPKHNHSVLVDGAENGIVVAYDRTVPRATLESLRYLRVKGTQPEPIKLKPTGDVVFSAFQGRSSIRELVQGASDLDTLLAPVSIPVYGPPGLQVAPHPLVSLHLGLLGDELPLPAPATSEQPHVSPIRPRPTEPNTEVVAFATLDELLDVNARRAAFARMHPPIIAGHGVLVVVGLAPSLPWETFDILRDIREQWQVSTVSIHVQRIG